MPISTHNGLALYERNWRRPSARSTIFLLGMLGAVGCGGSPNDSANVAPLSDAGSAPGTVAPIGTTVGNEPDASTGANTGEGTADGAAGHPQVAEDGATVGPTTHADAGSAATTDAAGSTGADASRPTGTIDASTGQPPPPPAGDAGAACVSDLPSGWSLTAFNTNTDPCPTAYTEHIVFGPPAIGAGACSCACSVTEAGSCGQGSLAMLTNPGHHNDACTMAWFTATVNGSACIPVPAASQGTLGNFQASPLAASGQGGTCAETAQTNAGLLSEPTQRFCDVPAASAEAVCNGSAPTGFSSCIVANGNVPCPGSTPFVHPFTVESGASLACGSCSACSVTTTCGTPTLSAFTDANCTAPAALNFNVDGTCVGNPAEQTVLSIQYDAVGNAACTAGTSASSAVLSQPQTICCR